MTDEEYAQARRTTQYAHYTSEGVIRSIYDGLTRMGFAGGSVLEPGMGVGSFRGLMPSQVMSNSQYTGVEYDTFTGKIAKHLYPDSNVIIGDFTRTKLPKEFFDAAIGNPPFSRTKVTADPEYRKHSFMLHDYFFAKTIDRVKPGGLVTFVTSKGTMDKGNARARQYLAERANLVGAIRLPQTAFKDNAGTEVVTDVLFFQKRGPGVPENDVAWLGTKEISTPQGTATINEYFADHPEMVLGEHAMTGSMYRSNEYTVTPRQGVDIEQAFAEAIKNLPEDMYRPQRGSREEKAAVVDRDFNPKHQKEGGVYLGDDGTLRIIENGSGVALESRTGSNGKNIPLNPKQKEWLKGYVGVRDALKQAQLDQLTNGNWEASLKALNDAYDAFTKKHGKILAHTVSEKENADGSISVTRRFKNNPLLDIDVESPLVYAIEDIKPDGSIVKAPSMLGRTLQKDPEPQIKTTQDALFVSLNQIGSLNVDDVARLAGISRDEVISELGDLIYNDPSTGWTMADEYLSGDVVKKLREAEAAARVDRNMRRNVEALKAVQPRQLAPADITVQLGSHWVPASDVQNFAAEILNERIDVNYSPQAAAWSAEGGRRMAGEWSTSARSTGEILDGVLNNRQLKVTYRDSEGKTHTDTEATEAVNNIAKKMRDAFRRWIWQDTARTERLVSYYNENFNNIVPRQFDGSHLTLPGVSTRFDLYPHQKRAIWRAIQEGNTYFAHSVGAGKAQPLDAKILTPNGWKLMGDIKPGDMVITQSGKPTMVEAVFPQGDKEIYRVSFSDGSSTECCDEHLWLTHTYAERNAANNALRLGKEWECAKPKVRQLSEIRETLNASHLGAKNHSIPMVEPVEFDQQLVPLDPYLIGALIGDGHIGEKSVSITGADHEVIYSLVVPDGVHLRKNDSDDRCTSWHFIGTEWRNNPVLTACRDLGLAGKVSHEKFVPDVYKFNDTQVRLAVLKGLMDTDGTVSKRGHSASFSTASNRLADDVAFLVQSLGGTAKISTKKTAYAHNGERKNGRLAYNVSVSMPANVNPFHIGRKAGALIPKTKYKPTRYIVGVEPIGRKAAQCIRVSDPSHLYVTDDFIVTHNTFTMIAAGMEERRLGLSRKPAYVVPNHMLAQFSKEFLELYPTANIMVADEKNFHTRNRQRFVAQAALNDPDAIIITHSAFGMIGMSDEFSNDFIQKQVDEMRAILDEVDKSDRLTRKQIEQRIEQLENRLVSKQRGEKKDKVLTFEELGVDRLFVDEAHEFRKLDFATNRGNIKGIDSTGSQKALDLFMKTQYLEQKNPGRSLVMASGTPVTNTMGELYTVQRFFQQDQLEADGLSRFDAWSNHFGEVVEGFEQNAAGGYQVVSRFAKFVNVADLMSRVRSFMDVLTSEQLGDLVQRPSVEGGQREVVVTPVPDGYKAYQKELESRIKQIQSRSGPPAPGDDIILNVIADGRFSAIDMRFVDPTLPSDPNSKLNRLLDDVIAAYHDTAENEYRTGSSKDPVPGSSLMVFTDLGLGEASAKNRVVDMKAWMRKRLIDGGVSPSHIAFMRDNKQHAKKERLFSDMRQGKKRILIGGKDMETGVNVQKRLSHLFHLDAPWFPAAVEQREGRIIRQGNQNQSVNVKAYATKGSYDSTMWGMLSRKARFIEQAMSGDANMRSMDDVSEASSFEMASALASGDERYLKMAGLKSDVERLNRLYSAHRTEQRQLANDERWVKSSLDNNRKIVGEIETALKSRQEIRAGEFEGKVGSQTFDKREDFSNAIFDAFKAKAEANTEGDAVLGKLGGFDVVYSGLKLKGSGDFSASLDMRLPGDNESLAVYPIDPGMSISGIATRAVNQVNRLDRDLADRRDQVEQLERRLEKIESRKGAPFAEMQELTDKQDELTELELELASEQSTMDEAQDEAAQQESSTVIADSASLGGRGLTTDEMDARLREGSTGEVMGRLLDNGKIVLHDTVRNALPGAPAGTAAFVDTRGRVHLIGRNISPQTMESTIMHEMFHSAVRPLIGTEQWNSLQRDLGRLYRQYEHSSGKARDFFDMAKRRIDYAQSVGDTMNDARKIEEFGAYAIEEYANAPASLKKWVDNMLGHVKAWLRRAFGIQAGQITPAQLRSLTLAAMRNGELAPSPSLGTALNVQQIQEAERAAAEHRAVAQATKAIRQPDDNPNDFDGGVIRDLGRVANWVQHPYTIASLNPEFTPVFRTGMRQAQFRDEIIAEMFPDFQNYHSLPAAKRANVNKVLEIGRLTGMSFTEQSLKDGIINPGFKTVVAYDENGDIVRRKEPIHAALTKPNEEVKLTAEERTAYIGLRQMFDGALDRFRDQTLIDFNLSEFVGLSDPVSAIMDSISDDMSVKQQERLQNIAQTIQEIEQAKRTGYVPLSRYGRYAITVKEDRANIEYVKNPEGGWIARGVPDDMDAFMEEIGATWNDLEGGWQVDGAQRQALRRENSRTVYSEKVEATDLRDRMIQWRAEKTGAPATRIPAVRAARDRIKQEWVGDHANRRISVFDTQRKQDKAKVSLTELDSLAELTQLDNETWGAVREQFSKAMQGRGFRKHFFHSDNVPGYTADFERAIGDYIASMAGHLSRRHHERDWQDSISNIKGRRMGRYAEEYKDYVNNPQEEYAMLRLTGFLFYIAGNVSTAALNATQVPIMTMPILTQASNSAIASMEVTRAYKDALRMTSFVDKGMDMFDPADAPADVRDEVQAAWDEGMFAPQFTHEVMGFTGRSDTGLKAGYEKTINYVASSYTYIERLNRLVTYIAAVRTAKRKGTKANAERAFKGNALARHTLLGDNWSPKAFGEFIVDESQFLMGKQNRSKMLRSHGAAIFQFMSFVMNSLQAWYRWASLHGRDGKMGVAASIAAIVALSGIWGAPGLDHLREIYERFYAWMFGEDEDLKASLRQWIYEKTGSVRLAEIVDKGGLYPLGMDMSGRIGMMSIAPDLTSVTGALGIPADLLIGRPVRAIEKARSGDTLGAVGEALPNFAKNPIIAQSWREKGVRSGRGQQILTPDQIPTHALWYKSLGIQSTAVTNARDYLWAQYRSQTRIDGIKGRYLNRIAQAETEAIRNENPERQAEIEARIEAVWAEVDAYNRANPERPIRIRPSQIRQRIERNLYGLEALAGKERRDARTDAEMLREVYRIDETLEMDDER